MRLWVLIGAMASFASAAVAQPTSEQMKVMCESASKDWSPVRLPTAGVTAAVPCNDKELSAFKASNEERKRTEGLAGCERAGRTFIVMYLVNTPAGFFDRFTSGKQAPTAQSFQVNGHRAFRAAAIKDGKASGQQLFEVDAKRAVLMMSNSKVPNDAEYAKITTCFFNTLLVATP